MDDLTRDPAFGIRLSKQAFTFSAAHFITYDGDTCERLHGHNYRVSVEVSGGLDENAYVLDFVATSAAISAITAELDHRVLLPTEHPLIHVEESADRAEVIARFRDRRWVFPSGDCVLLALSNTTAELLARWIGERLLSGSGASGLASAAGLTVVVEECDGQSGICRL